MDTRGIRVTSDRRLLAPLVALVVFAATLFAVAPPAAATCSGNVARTTPSNKLLVANYLAYWSTSTDSAGAPCVDVNVINEGWDDNAFRGAYKGSDGNWHLGTLGWVGINEGYLGVVITDLTPTGVPVKAANEYDGGNWDIRILT
ncbi:MAG: hypothetical protein GXP34_10935 [Actinobacteria bacterium]|nr:hypothetical protein [Actinomycetota bacterium]